MAEDNNTEEIQESGSKPKKKVIIIILLVAILAVGLSVGVTLFLLSDGDEAAEDLIPEKEMQTTVSYLEIKPPLLITYNVGGRQRYMQISLSIASRDPSAFTSLEYHMPLIRSKLISTYSAMNFNIIKTEAGKVELQSKTVEVINSVLESEGEGQIENIYFTNFVLQ